MSGYVQEALTRFRYHDLPKLISQDQPHRHVKPTYGASVQYAKAPDTSLKLNADDKRYIQQVTGTFLYYGRALDSTMLTALSAIASDQSAPTEETMRKTKTFLHYSASHPDAIITFRASSMILSVHSDASYLSEPKARSRAGGHFYMSDNSDSPKNNGAVLNIAQIIKSVMSSAAESELDAPYINAREVIPARITLG